MGTLGNPSKDEHNVAMSQRHTEATKSVNREKSLQSTAATPPESKTCHSLFGRTVLNPERLRTAKALVDKAVKMHMIFSIQGPYPVVGAALRARGWVERRMLHPSQHTYRHTNASDDDDYNMEDVEKEFDSGGMYDIMSRMVRNETVYFYWTNRRDAIDNRMLHKEQITNHFAKAGSFTTKVGLCVNLRNLCWFDSADPETFFPRCYRLGAEDDKHAFIEDYRRTACTSLLQCVAERSQRKAKDQSNQNKKKQNKHCQDTPLVPSKMIDCALKVCRNFLDSLEHNDIDMSLEASQALTQEQWSELIKNYYLAVHDGVEIEDSLHFVNRCQTMLCRLREVSPQLDTDGIHNVWIIKPGAMSRGRGIVCVKRLDEILQVVESDPTLIKDSKWVVQKYLERPLLVHDTKFDVRQWFLVTDWNPLTIWLYKKCYLRFCTQPYSLDTLDSSAHLCNNSIQKHLQPSQRRHPAVPADNMWSCDQFRTFLSSQGRAAQWESIVVPGMKKAVIHALQTTQDLVESRKNTFELYGADFILGQDMCPWLIEINASPTMAPSTTVTARLCAAVQEDTLKVVLDRRQDRTANTGEFQLIYKQAAVEVPHYVGINLNVEGSQMKYPHPAPPPKHSHPSEHWPVLPALRRWGPSKVKESWIEKTRSLEILRLQLMPMGKIDSFHLPISAQATRSLDSWRRPQVLKHRSGKVRHLAPERQQHFLPVGVINPFHDSEKGSHSARVSTARVSVSHPMNSFRNLPRHQTFHQTRMKTLLGSGINKHS